METGIYALLTKVGAAFSAVLAFFHININHWQNDHMTNFANHLPFVSLMVKTAQTPVTTRLLEAVIIAVGVGFFLQISAIPEIKAEIGKVDYKQQEFRQQMTESAGQMNKKLDHQAIEIDKLKERVIRIEK